MREDLFPAIQMTNACNKSCAACLRSANSLDDELSYPDVQKYLNDLRALSEAYRLRYQFVTGGEPTIWEDTGKDIVDVLAALHALGLIENLTMPSNGKLFEDLSYAREFFTRLSRLTDKPLIVGISIADYQENLSENGYVAMDNLLRLRAEPGLRLQPHIMVTLSADDDTDERLQKIYPGVRRRVVALAPLGDASDMSAACPSLSLHGHDKSTLGSFLPYFRLDVLRKLGIPETEFDDYPNAEMMDRLSQFNNCGNAPFIDGRWNFCLPFKDDDRYDLGGLGEMRPDTIRKFLEAAPVLDEIRKEGVITAIRRRRSTLRQETRDKLDALFAPSARVSVAYRGCMVCKAMYDAGIIGECVGPAPAPGSSS